MLGVSLPITRRRRWALIALSLFFVLGGLNHFFNESLYLKIMPPWLPAPLMLIFISGVLEVVGGVGVLVKPWRPAMGWLLVVVIVGVTPANIHMAMNPSLYPSIPVWALYLRLPLQGLIICWAWCATRPETAR